MSFAARLLQNSSDPIYLVTGKDDTGGVAWYYVHVNSIKLKSFKEALAVGNFSLTSYGIILESGYGAEPSADVEARLKKEYNF